MLRSSRTPNVEMSADEWLLQKSPRASRLAAVKEVVNAGLGEYKHLMMVAPRRGEKLWNQSCKQCL